MNKIQKEQVIEDVRARFEASPFLALVEYQGSTVAQMDTLRRSCEQQGVHFQVVKNTLSKRALNGTEKTALSDHFKGPVGIFFSGEDPIAAAKLLKEQVKGNDKLLVKAGYFEGDVLNANGVEAVASLPGREELLSTLLATIEAAPRQVMGVIQGPARDILYLLKNFETKLSS
jgi:large subunit ribosomal protein L10